MSGSQPTNTAAVDFEKQQAAEADAKEAARQQRLTQGQTLIDQIFNGAPVMGTKSTPFDWSSFKPGNSTNPLINAQLTTGVPEGYTAVQIPGGGGGAGGGWSTLDPTLKGGSTNAGDWGVLDPTLKSGTSAAGSGSWSALDPTLKGLDGGAGGGMSWGLKDASGKIYKSGDPLSISSQYDTGKKTGGFDDAFFDSYKQKVLDYYQPDEQRQYDAAQRDLKYSLARAGTLQSSTAADKQGELAYNDSLQKANIVANANSQEGQLKSQIQANKQSLINQLYSTEDPTLTANLAQSSAQASRLQDPTLTPAAALFTPALTTVGSAVQGLLYPSGAGASTFANPNQSPTPASASGNPGSGVLTR